MLLLYLSIEPSNVHNSRPRDPVISRPGSSSSSNSSESRQDQASSLDIDKMIQTNLMQYDHRLIGGLGGGLSLNMNEFRSEPLRSEPSVGNSNHHHHQQMYVEPLQLDKLGIDSSFNNDRYLRQRSSFIGLPANQQRQREGGEDDSMALDILGGDTSQLSYMFGNFNMMNLNEKSQQQQQQQQTFGGDQSRPLTSTSSPTVGSARPDSRSSGVDMSLNMNGTTTMPISSSSFDSHYHFNSDGRTTDDDDMFNKAYSGNFMDSDAYVFKYDTTPPVELSFLSPSPKVPSSSVVAAAALSLSPMTSLLHRSDEDTYTSGGGGGGGVDNKMGGIASLSSGQLSPMDAPGRLSRVKSSSRVILPVVSVSGSPQQASRENSTMILFTNGRCKSMDVIASSSSTVVNSSRTASDESSCNSVLDLLNNEVMLELSDHSPSGKKKKFIKPSLLKSSSCPVNSKIYPVNCDVLSSPSMSRELSISIDSHDSL